MEKIVFDSGVKEFRVNGKGVLRFNPADPNVYARFMEAGEKILEIEKQLQAKNLEQNPEENSTEALKLLAQADSRMKEVLGWVFGGENDFSKILGGVHLMAVAENGERVIINLLKALEPILVAGAERCATEKIRTAKAQASVRRAAQ